MNSQNFSLFAAILLVLFTSGTAQAHPGRTASDGCHYCRTNCDSWGVAWNQRHCHGGGGSTGGGGTAVRTQPSCPANSYLSGGTCTCNIGYAAFQNRCYKIPVNAHAIVSVNAAWECDSGYIERGENCVKKPEPEEIKPKEPSAQEEEDIEEVQGLMSEAVPNTEAEAVAVESAVAANTVPSKSSSSGNGALATAAVVGGGGYYFYRRRKKMIS